MCPTVENSICPLTMTMTLDPVKKLYSTLFTSLCSLLCSPSHPTEANKELRKHLSHILLSGRCHFMLISSFNARENTQLVHWQGHQSFQTPAILHSLETDHSLKKLSWLSPLCGREMFPSLICVSQMTRFPPSGRVLCEKNVSHSSAKILRNLVTFHESRGARRTFSASVSQTFFLKFFYTHCSALGVTL